MTEKSQDPPEALRVLGEMYKTSLREVEIDLEALGRRVNELERVVNRLSHWCSAAVEGTTIPQDNWDEPAPTPPPMTHHDGKDVLVDTVASRKNMLT
jgi:hypothetical protein